VADSSAEAYLMEKGIKQVRSFGNPEEGLQSLVEKKPTHLSSKGPS